MRDVNPRSRERFDLSLDGRQIASVVVGAIVVLAVVFVLGLNVGKQLARSEVRPPSSGGDALAALDQAPPSPGVRDEALTYHDRLVKERPAAAPAAPAVQDATPPAPPIAAATAAATPPPPPASEPAADPAARAASDEPRPAPPAAPEERPATEPAGDWCVQLGAANDRVESERIAARFERFAPRIETAVIQGKTWYRVRVGAFATKVAAEKYLKDLSRETGAKGYVTPTH
jgi:cell division protein FtsN